MKKQRLALLSACLIGLSSGAIAQTAADKRLDEIQKASEQMKPTANPPVRAAQPATMAAPQSAADKRVDEIQKASEQMKPR